MKTNLHVRNKRWVNALVNVGVQALSTFLTHVRDNKLKKGITWLKEDNLRQDQEIRAVKEDLLSFAKASIKDLAETRGEVRQQGNLLKQAIDELSELKYKVDHLETTITDINYAIQTLSTGLTNLFFVFGKRTAIYCICSSTVPIADANKVLGHRIKKTE